MPYKREYHTIICPQCGKEYQVLTPAFKRKQTSKYGLLCASCAGKAQWESMDESKKREMIQKSKEKYMEKYNSLTEEEKQELINKRKAGVYKYWTGLSDEERDKRLKEMSIKSSMAKSKISKEQWKKIGKNISDGKLKAFQNMSDEEREAFRKKKQIERKNYWDSLSSKDRDIIIKNLAEGNHRFHQSSTREKYTKSKETYQEWFNSLSNEKREELIQRKILGEHNKFRKRFEKMFNESHLVNDFIYKPDVTTSVDGDNYKWDYGIYNRDGKLEMVVHLDNQYLYGEDIELPLAGDDVKRAVIYEDKIKISFESMLQMLMVNYDDYVNQMFTWCRLTPFPYPYYPDSELMSSFAHLQKLKVDKNYNDDISLNTRVGDRLIQHFHHSIWHDKREGELSPYEAWQDDELLFKVIQNRVIYQTHMNPSKVLQGFNVTKVGPKVSVFSAGRAKLIIHKYLDKYDTIFDPFSGYSGRMLGAISLGKKYIGQDISFQHVIESRQIMEFLKQYKVKFDSVVLQRNTLETKGEYQCLFTCSPYSEKEQWKDVPVDSRSCDDWIDVCLENFKCERYVFVVDETKRYKEYVKDIIGNKSHFGLNAERVIVIDRAP